MSGKKGRRPRAPDFGGAFVAISQKSDLTLAPPKPASVMIAVNQPAVVASVGDVIKDVGGMIFLSGRAIVDRL